MNHQVLLTTAVGLLVTINMTPNAVAQEKLRKTTVAYREIDGHKILADIFRPAGDDVRPVIV